MSKEKQIVVVPVLSSLSFAKIAELNGTTMTKKEFNDWVSKQVGDVEKEGFAVYSVENFIDKMNYDDSRKYFFACVTIKK